MFLFLFALFILGASIGSFLNVCIWRLPRGESVVHPPSHCPKCDTRLRAIDLVPLLSQVFLRARCRYCGAKISWRYFGIEFLTGVLFVMVGAHALSALPPGTPILDPVTGTFSFDWVLLLRGLLVAAALVVVFWVDYDTYLIQLEAVFLLGLAGIAVDLWQVVRLGKPMTTGPLFPGIDLLPVPLPESLLAMTVTATALWLIREIFSRLFGKEAMGFGDVILVAGIAANLGWNTTIWTFFFLSVVVGALVGVTLQIPRAIRGYRWAQTRTGAIRGRAFTLAMHAFRRAMPFGPMLAIGAIIAMLYGPQLNQAYLDWVNGPLNPPIGINGPTAP